MCALLGICFPCRAAPAAKSFPNSSEFPCFLVKNWPSRIRGVMTDKGWSFVRASSVSSSRPFRLPPCRLSSGVLIPFLGRRVPNLE